VARYHIVPDRSAVVIDARSNVHPIHHRAHGIEGFVDLEVRDDGSPDLAAGAAAELTLAVDRLAARNPLETHELRRRIDARRFPVITGRLDELRETDGAKSLLARGGVTFRGVTRPAEDVIRVTSPAAGTLRIEGTHEFDIRDFGMEPPRVLMMRVEPVVRVQLTVVAELRD
jgi:hypothetical protein